MNVGDYVKFKDKRGNTYIRQIKDLPQDIRYGAIKIDIEANYSDMLSPKNVIKSSPNIIDLIEVGDYVNGHRVNFIDGDREYFVISFGNDAYTLKSQFNDDIYWLAKDDIKSIVTKEQFESMKYEVK